MTSHFDPELFRPNASERLANMAMDSLDDMGGDVDHLKSIIIKSLQNKPDTPSIDEQLKKGLV